VSSTSLNRTRAQRRQGFTLIELLVVIAIIAILAAILFPVFAQARAKARQTSCLSNLKQLTLATSMYQQDYDGSFPYWNWWFQADAGGCGGRGNAALDRGCGHYDSLWLNAIYPYTKNGQIYACPSDVQNLTPGNSSIWWWTSSDPLKVGMLPQINNQKVSYGFNEPLHFGELYSWPGVSPTSDATLQKPAQTLVIADSVHVTSGSPTTGVFPDPGNPKDPLHNCLMRRVAYAQNNDGTWAGDCSGTNKPEWDSGSRHSAGQNLGYADGHAGFKRNTQTNYDLFRGDQTN
jgi:prepilin-type N-terminal cleavage/methylation domain-containing protein